MSTLRVIDITNLIAMNLEDAFRNINVEGEISNSKLSATGHWYFSLKDNEASINCVMFRSKLYSIGGHLPNGSKVVVKGSVQVYKPNGSYSINCVSVNIVGEGSIAQMLEERKKDFQRKGYFDKHITTLPKYPKSICAITSETGAALQDIIRTTNNRAPSVKIYVLSTVVQGEAAAKNIARAIEYANENKIGEVLIVGRGGGSLEDLLPFSDELVVKAISESNIPVISAVGHEIDTPLSDFAATVSASTPTQGAEKATIGYETIEKQLANNKRIISNNLNNRIYTLQRNFDHINEKIHLHTLHKVKSLRSRYDNSCAKSNAQGILKSINQQRQEIKSMNQINYDIILNKISSIRVKNDYLKKIIESHSPKTIFDKGFSIIQSKEGKLIQSVKDIKKDMELEVVVKDGVIKTKVIESKESNIWQV